MLTRKGVASPDGEQRDQGSSQQERQEANRLNTQILTAVGFLGYFLTGIVNAAFAPAFPYLIQEFGLTLGAAGLIFPIRALGNFLGTLLGGIWSDSAGRKLLIIAGAVLQGVGFALVPLTRNWSLALPAFFLFGLGGGFVNAALNALVAEVNPARTAFALNALHGIYGLGSLLGPFAAAYILYLDGAWQTIFLASAAIWAAYGALCLLPAYPRPGGRQKGRVTGAWPLLVSPVFLLLLAVPFLYNGTALSLVGWITTYVQRDLRLPVLLGASMVSLYYAGLTVGRFLCGALGERVGYGKMLLVLSLGAAASYPLVVISESPLMVGAGVFLTGLFFSGAYPTALAWAATLHPKATGTITGILATGMSVGGMTVPPLLGLIGDRMGLGFSMTVNCAGALALVVVSMGLLRLQRRA